MTDIPPETGGVSREWRCHWCGRTYKTHRSMSRWEQKAKSGYKRLCNRCATRRLGNPWSVLLDSWTARPDREGT